MQIILNGKTIDVQVIRKPNKNIYMRFPTSSLLLVTCNSFVSEKELEHILKKNTSSLEKMLEKKILEDTKDIFFQYLGNTYTRIFDGMTKEVTFINDNVIAKDEKTLNKFYQKECVRVFQSEIDRILPNFSHIPKFTLKIRKMKTRWGVNNRRNNTITLNSDLLKKKIDLLDYVIIHELCHYYEPNHSASFWNYVSKYYPNYKEARKRLRYE